MFHMKHNKNYQESPFYRGFDYEKEMQRNTEKMTEFEQRLKRLMHEAISQLKAIGIRPSPR